MAKTIDKIIITNQTALKSKYGNSGATQIRNSVDDLAAADTLRGLTSSLICLDDAAAMKKLGGIPVTDKEDPKKNKIAVDVIYKAFAPDYMLILGAADVVPHQDLRNPLYGPSPNSDPDKIAFGDLPYACDAPFSQSIQDFLGPTRVVGRLPDLTGGTDPAYLIGLLQTAASYKVAVARDYHPYFGITAEIWEKSTGLSLVRVFGTDTDLKAVPPNSENWPLPLIGRLAHFINCHGADTSSQFYGQPANGQEEYPIALDAAYVAGKINEGTVAAAECCYGGQLYDPSLVNGQQGICNTYLANKAYGFFASTTIAYGPSDSNAQADLICQYFLQSVFSGASLGRAALEARQKFVRASSPLDPSDLKTLGQYNLYGDPSITPAKVPSPTLDVAGPKSANVMTVSPAESSDRSDRRRMLLNVGLGLARTEPQAHLTAKKPARSVEAALQKKAHELGITPTSTLSFVIKYPAASAESMPKAFRAKRKVPARFHVVFGKADSIDRTSRPPVPRIVALIGKEVGGEVVSMTRTASR